MSFMNVIDLDPPPSFFHKRPDKMSIISVSYEILKFIELFTGDSFLRYLL